MNRYFSLILLATGLYSCQDPSTEKTSFSRDTVVIEAGRSAFRQNCASCHELQTDGIGPALGGITLDASREWLHRFIRNPQEVISSGDKLSDSLIRIYRTVMPAFPGMPDAGIDSILSFLHAQPHPPHKPAHKRGGLLDPIPEKIPLSGLMGDLTPVVQFPPTNEAGKRPATRITKMAFEPVSGALFVNDLRGKLYKLVNGKPVLYLDLVKVRPKFVTEPGLGSGFGSFAFHPDFATNGLLYTTHTEAPDSGPVDFSYPQPAKAEVQWVLTEWKVGNKTADSITGNSRELLRLNMVTGAHGVQEITFNPLIKKGARDYGLLYVGVGDGMSVEVGYPLVPHGKNKIWGSIIRINPTGTNSRNGKYGVPETNPFYHDKDSSTVREIFAYGFRNPHRITWTSNGIMLASNIGQTNIESVNLIKPGLDFGWPQREGNFVMNPYGDLDELFPLPANDSANHFSYPVAQFDHDEGNAITGGYEYTGSAIPALKGKFIFGDIPSGRLFYFDLSDLREGRTAAIREWKIRLNRKPVKLKEIVDGGRVDMHFGRDKQGELYIMTKYDGMLYKITGAQLMPSK